MKIICVYFYDYVSGCFYPFVNKIELRIELRWLRSATWVRRHRR